MMRRAEGRPKADKALRGLPFETGKAISQKIRRLQADPSGESSEPFGNLDQYRAFPIDAYLIVYRVTDDAVIIEYIGDRLEVYHHYEIEPPTNP